MANSITSQNIMVNDSVPSKFSPSAKMPEIVRRFYTQCENAENFLIILSGFNVFSKKKKRKVLRLSSASFLRALCDIPGQGAVNRSCLYSCLQFLVGNKNAGFWREKKRRNWQNFSAKMPEKILHFFALLGNTG